MVLSYNTSASSNNPLMLYNGTHRNQQSTTCSTSYTSSVSRRPPLFFFLIYKFHVHTPSDRYKCAWHWQCQRIQRRCYCLSQSASCRCHLLQHCTSSLRSMTLSWHYHGPCSVTSVLSDKFARQAA